MGLAPFFLDAGDPLLRRNQHLEQPGEGKRQNPERNGDFDQGKTVFLQSSTSSSLTSKSPVSGETMNRRWDLR